MKALDDAVAAELAIIAPEGVPVYYGSADRNDPPPYYVHHAIASQKGRIGTAGFGGPRGLDARQYQHAILAVSRDPDEAEALREAAYGHFQGRRLAPAGWEPTTPCDWAGEVHDPGEMLPGGELVFFAGDHFTIDIYRQRG